MSHEAYLLAQSAAVPRARKLVSAQLALWRLTGPDAEELADSTALITSELVTNAITAASEAAHEGHTLRPGAGPGRVGLRLRISSQGLSIDVWDPHPAAPTVKDAGPLDESGRGLTLVGALASRWDWYACKPPIPGKITWAELTIPAALADLAPEPTPAQLLPHRVQAGPATPRAAIRWSAPA